MDDCGSLQEAVPVDHRAASLGVLDLVSDRALVVTGVYTSAGLSDPQRRQHLRPHPHRGTAAELISRSAGQPQTAPCAADPTSRAYLPRTPLS